MAGMHSACSRVVQEKDRKEKEETRTHTIPNPSRNNTLPSATLYAFIVLVANEERWTESWRPEGPFSPWRCDIIWAKDLALSCEVEASSYWVANGRYIFYVSPDHDYQRISGLRTYSTMARFPPNPDRGCACTIAMMLFTTSSSMMT